MDESIQKIKAKLIANTRTRNRIDNLYEIANLILKLKNHFGSLKKVSEEVADISPNMLNRFLSVLKLDISLIPLIKSRQLDNINAAYYIQTLGADEQQYIARLLTSKRLNSADIRAIRPLKTKFPNRNIDEILRTVLSSKNKKRYLIKFDISSGTSIDQIKNKLHRIVPEEEFIIEKKKNMGTIILTKFGNDLIKSLALESGKPYHEIISGILTS